MKGFYQFRLHERTPYSGPGERRYLHAHITIIEGFGDIVYKKGWRTVCIEGVRRNLARWVFECGDVWVIPEKAILNVEMPKFWFDPLAWAIKLSEIKQ